MDKLEFTLKQHTPIIHFQHDQDGATLRATEVKPKLDRYIIEQLGGKSRVPDEWFNNEEKGSLDYKLRIEQNSELSIAIQNRHANSPMYFGNMGNKPEDIAKYKHFKYTAEEIRCSILSICSKEYNGKNLLQTIEDLLYSFFFQNNFGTRQSKGYGSFEVSKIYDFKSNTLKLFTKNRQSNYQIKLDKVNDYKEALEQVSYFYKSLRSGINLIDKQIYNNPKSISKSNNIEYYLDINTTTKYYIKPLIFLYAKDKLKKQWDKRTIKQTYFKGNIVRFSSLTKREKREFKTCFNINDKAFENRNLKWFINEAGLEGQLKKHLNSDILSYSNNISEQTCHYDFKDVFGLSSEESWRSYGKTIVNENVQKNSTSNNIGEKNKNSKDYIDRFKSPLLFKLIKEKDQFKVYILFSNLPSEYKGSKFSVYPKRGSSKLVLEIPEFLFQNIFNFISDST